MAQAVITLAGLGLYARCGSNIDKKVAHLKGEPCASLHGLIFVGDSDSLGSLPTFLDEPNIFLSGKQIYIYTADKSVTHSIGEPGVPPS